MSVSWKDMAGFWQGLFGAVLGAAIVFFPGGWWLRGQFAGIENRLDNKIGALSERVARIEGHLQIVSSKKVKETETRVGAKLLPHQKTLPVVVDTVDVSAGRIYVWDAQDLPHEFSFSADAKVHKPGGETQLMQMFKNSLKGQAGILVYEAQASTAQPAVVKSLTLIPTP